jgi:UDP:flavonoid glycosyltransferase YjiC (YdhE family)
MRDACQQLGVAKATYDDFAQAWLNTPTFTTISPPVLPPPPDYPSYVHVTGFLFLEQEADWTPPSHLLDFLDAGEPPVYIGFGSMAGHTGEDTIAVLLEALDGRRGIINGGWSEEDKVKAPDSVYLLDGAPHDWLFPRMGALVHHGGSGTTAAGLRAGKPTLVIPHLFDQFYFGRRIHELGAGPEPLSRRELSAAALQNRLDTLLTDDSLHGRAQTISRRIREEDSVTNIVTLMNKYLGQREASP